MKQTFEVKKLADCTLFIPLNHLIMSSNSIYFHKYNILVDPGNPISTRDLIEEMRRNGIEPNDVRHILCTHLHIDHIGSYWLFPRAKLYAANEEIEAFMTSSRYFQIDDRFSDTPVRISLVRALKLLSEQPYEKDLNKMDSFLEEFNSIDQISSGRNGFYMFPSHTPGSSVIVIDRVVLFGDIFSLDGRMDWIPKKYKDKLQLFHAARVYGKKNLISGHNTVVESERFKNDEAHNLKAMVKKGNNTAYNKTNLNNNNIRVHHRCDENGRIVSMYYCDSEGNKVSHKEEYYEIRYIYNKLGKVGREMYFDINGCPVANLYGSYGAQYNYNEKRQWILYIELDKNYKLRMNEKSQYFCSIYYYSNSNDNKITARVDFKNNKITKIKYLVDDIVIDTHHAFKRYHQIIEMLENNNLL